MKNQSPFMALSRAFIIILLLSSEIYSEKYMGSSGPGVQDWTTSLVDIGYPEILHWSNPNISWYLNSNAAGDELSFNACYTAVDAAFDSWQNISTSDVSFTYVDYTPNTWQNDGQNVFYWAEAGDAAAHGSGGPLEDAGYLAMTIVTYNANEELVDVDVVLDGRDRNWKINYDIQAVATHEIGHLIGLHHSNVPGSVMYQGYTINWRNIQNDDRLGASFLYGGRITQSKTLSGDKSFKWDITVMPGVTLTINSNAFVEFYNGAKITVNGTMNATNATLIPSNSEGGTWGGIRFNSGSSGTIQQCYIELATIGVYFNNSSIPVVTNNEIFNCTSYGIYLYNSSPVISYNWIHDNDVIGVYCDYYSSPVLHHNDITRHGSYGIDCYFYSSPTLGEYQSGYPSRGHNVITQNNVGIMAAYGSNIFLGDGSYGGYNCVHNSTGYEVEAVNCQGFTIKAEKTFWNRTTSPYFSSSDFNMVYSSIDYDPALSTDPNGCSPLKPLAENHLNISPIRNVSASITDNELNNLFIAEHEGKYDQVIGLYINKLKNEEDKNIGNYMLSRIADCYRLSGKQDFISFLNNVIRPAISGNNSWYATSLALEGNYLITSNKADKAIANYLKLRDSNSDKDIMLKYTLFNLGYTYFYVKNDRETGTAYFNLLKSEFPNELLTYNAKLLLGEINKIPEVYHNRQEEALVNRAPLDFDLFNNYPNPFNPSTVINYQLPLAGYVIIKVYDVLGSEAATLVDEVKEAGKYTSNFDGSNLASGIYFARITVRTPNGHPFVKTIKMLLTK